MNDFTCDVLCIGAGGAGLAAAVAASQSGAHALVLSKLTYGCGNTRIAGGLVLRPNISPRDSFDSLMRDMIFGGEFLNDQALVAEYCKNAYLATEILENLGLIFTRNASGKPAPLPVALSGHSLPRTLPVYSEGIPIGTALRSAAARAKVDVFDEAVAIRLITNGNSVIGAVCLDWATGQIFSVSAKQTILATGGLCWMFYPHTSNNRAITGDGFALALEAGAELVDMEQQQFIPFALTHPESNVGIVCGEPAIAGPYGRLIDAKGRDVVTDVRLKTRAELSAVMALAKERGDATEFGGLLLDLTPNFKHVIGEKMFEFLKRTFPSMIDVVKHAYGEQAARGLVPWDVFPTAHYQLGGVRVDSDCSVRGLSNFYAIGEVQGGLYGANRIASTSLADIIVFGWLTGKSVAEKASRSFQPQLDPEEVRVTQSSIERIQGRSGSHRPVQLMRRLQRTMWENAGPVRDEGKLLSAIGEIEKLREQFKDIGISERMDCNNELLDAIEFEKMLLVSEAVARSALERKETRGGHVRMDFPKRDDENWLKNIVVKKTSSGLAVRAEKINLLHYGLGTKGGPNAMREKIQYIILALLPRKMQERILNTRLNLQEDK